ncbi:oligosaccharide flippase family protein [Pseudoalteromonas sp. NZS71_1]|uniref:oligosaccharide flippase family protein n=1 Tax=Pseudoalteromonas sp. NZS71_1 TaxID=2792072 RepID=UPI0018CDAE2D|nr:oligosaccharide flippase family protein [Pseudoalteromonas sp. NZS71_1]MBH0036792.1 oligosaccharide flippase family protein [Pseudoalteromonas sp. NZS71_1]
MYLKNLSWFAAEKVIKILSVFLTSILISRSLTVEDFGQYSFLTSIIMIMLPVVMLGFDEFCYQKFITGKSEKFKSKLISNCISARLCLSFVILIAMFLFYLFIDIENIYLLLVLALQLPFSSFMIFQLDNNASLNSKVNAKINIISSVVFVTARLGLLYYNASIIDFIFIYVAETAFIATLLLFTKRGVKLKASLDIKFIFMVLKRTFPLLISSLAIILYYKIDQIMLGFMVGYESVGIYAIQAQIVMAVNLILQILINGTYPAWFRGGKINSELIVAIYKLSLLLSIVLLFFSYFLSETVITFLWGNHYIESSSLLSITLLGTLFSGFGYISSKKLISLKLESYRMRRVVIGMIINIILNLILIPLYGVYGAAISTVFSQIYSGFLGNYLSKKTRSVFFEQCKSLNILKLDEVFKLIKRLSHG